MNDEQKTQRDTPGRYTTNTPPSQGPDYNREAYYGGHADQTVPAPHAGEGTRGYDISEESAIRNIVDRLRQHSDIDPSQIQVTYDDGRVTLSGAVFREEIRQKAEELARAVPGVTDVRNDLRIVPRGLPDQPPQNNRGD